MIIEEQQLSEEDNEELFLNEMKYIEETFPNAKFSICIPIGELDNIISKEKTIILKRQYLDDNSLWKNDFYVINCDVMSVRNVIYEMINQDIEGRGNHIFLEDIDQSSSDNDTQFNIYFGS